MTTVLEKIARQLVTRTSFSAVAIERAEDAIVDTIACMIAGMNDAAPLSVAAAFRKGSTIRAHRWFSQEAVHRAPLQP